MQNCQCEQGYREEFKIRQLNGNDGVYLAALRLIAIFTLQVIKNMLHRTILICLHMIPILPRKFNILFIRFLYKRKIYRKYRK